MREVAVIVDNVMDTVVVLEVSIVQRNQVPNDIHQGSGDYKSMSIVSGVCIQALSNYSMPSKRYFFHFYPESFILGEHQEPSLLCPN
jgi:hypothetical protein